MKRAYLLAFSSTLGTQEEVKSLVDKIGEVSLWRYDLPNAFYLISEADAKTIAVRLRELAGDKGRFIITEINMDNTYGWLSDESWHLIKQKEYKPKAN